MGVSKNNGTPKASILIGFSIINHPFWGPPIFGNTHIVQDEQGCCRGILDMPSPNPFTLDLAVIRLAFVPGSKLSKRGQELSQVSLLELWFLTTSGIMAA